MFRQGEYKNNLSGDMMYLSFFPSALPPKPELVFDETLSALLSKASRSIGRLDSISTRIPSISIFVTQYIRKEALLSSQIEGTQATLDDILDPNIQENTNQNISEVINYIKASNYAEERLNSLPLCNRLLLETHKILMQDVRGMERNPGEFRRSQNWIGPQGGTLKNARYIPPNVEDMITAMGDFEKYMNTRDNTDPLIKIALLHYQFETIHPFLDGNGRIGRLLVYLFLKENGLLKLPAIYISYFLKRNRVEYYDRLTEVREKGTYEQWIKFFLQGLHESAEDAIDSIDLLCELHDRNQKLIEENDTRTKMLSKLFRYIEETPIIDITKTANTFDIAYNTAANTIKRLVELGFLQKVGSAQRGRIFAYEEYLKILRKDT